MATYEVRVVDINGTSFGTATDARIGKISFELNGPGSADITLATTDPNASLFRPGREVQILRDGAVFFWGPIIRPRSGLRESTWQCANPLWYFDHRFMGRADRVNLIANGDFEAGELNWSFVNNPTHSVDTVVKVEGAQSLKLTGTTNDFTGYATQTYTHAAQSHPAGDALTASAWGRVASADYQGGAIRDRGLLAVRRAADGTAISLGQDVGATEINDDTERDVWLQFETLVVGVQQGEKVEIRLYAPHGTVNWDLVTLTAMESLYFGDKDVAVIIDGIVKYAQDLPSTYYGSFNHGKSNLNIAVNAPATGVIATRNYMFAEHRNISDALFEFVRQGVLDIDVVYTATTRTLTTYAPRKGSLYGTTLQLDTHIADFTYSWDGERAAGTVVMLGPGDGPDRPEGGATDATFLGGLTLEIVEQAPDEATVGELDARAAERLAVAKNPEILEVTTLPGAGVIGNLRTGDTVPIIISHGHVNINATYRVVRIDVDPYMDQATLTLNVTGT